MRTLFVNYEDIDRHKVGDNVQVGMFDWRITKAEDIGEGFLLTLVRPEEFEERDA